jgi:hypothetical protein
MSALKKDTWVRFLPAFADEGDDEIGFITTDDESKGRVTVMACLGWPINPTQVVDASWLVMDESWGGMSLPPCHIDSPQHQAWLARVAALEADGLDTTDAQSVADVEFERGAQ